MNPKILEIDGWMHPIELEWLYNTAQRIPTGSLIVEIGAWKGRASAALYEGAGNDKTVVSIDTWKGQPDLLDSDHAEAKTKDIFKLYLMNLADLGFNPQPYYSSMDKPGPKYLISDSVEAAKMFAEETIDWIFIDGDHRKTGADIDAFLPKMKPNSIITGHDYFCFYETIQQEIHKRFYIHEIHYSVWVRYVGWFKPSWY